LFDFERQFSPGSVARIVATRAQERSVQQRRRDVFESHRHRVFAVGYYMTANELEAEAILTETFIHAFAAQSEPDAAAVDRALVGQLEQRFSLEPAGTAVLDADLTLARMATRRTDMEEALRLLPPAERLVFLLKDVEGYSPGRIAELLDRPEKEVLRTLFSARIRMRNALAAVQSAYKAVALTTPVAAGQPNPARPVEAGQSATQQRVQDRDQDRDLDPGTETEVDPVPAMHEDRSAQHSFEQAQRGA